MFLIFALQRADVLPTGDLGIRNAMRKAYNLEALPTPEEMEQMAHALASLLLGGELVPVAQPGRRRQPVAGSGSADESGLIFHSPLKIPAVSLIIGSGY